MILLLNPILAVALCVAPALADFEFCWYVAHEQDASMAVVKFERLPVAIAIEHGSKTALLSPLQAEAIGKILLKSDASFELLKKSGRDGTESFATDSHTIRFKYAADGERCSVSVIPRDQKNGSEFTLTRRQSTRFSSKLANAGKLVEEAKRLVDG